MLLHDKLIPMKSIVSLVLFTVSALAGQPVVELKVDQAGYLPGQAKLALVEGKAVAQVFAVHRASDGKVVFHARLGPAQTDPDSGDTVRAADITKLSKAGRYYM